MVTTLLLDSLFSCVYRVQLDHCGTCVCVKPVRGRYAEMLKQSFPICWHLLSVLSRDDAISAYQKNMCSQFQCLCRTKRIVLVSFLY